MGYTMPQKRSIFENNGKDGKNGGGGWLAELPFPGLLQRKYG